MLKLFAFMTATADESTRKVRKIILKCCENLLRTAPQTNPNIFFSHFSLKQFYSDSVTAESTGSRISRKARKPGTPTSQRKKSESKDDPQRKGRRVETAIILPTGIARGKPTKKIGVKPHGCKASQGKLEAPSVAHELCQLVGTDHCERKLVGIRKSRQ